MDSEGTEEAECTPSDKWEGRTRFNKHGEGSTSTQQVLCLSLECQPGFTHHSHILEHLGNIHPVVREDQVQDFSWDWMYKPIKSDSMHSRVLKELDGGVANLLPIISCHIVPCHIISVMDVRWSSQWLERRIITPIFKTGIKEHLGLVSCTFIPVKIMDDPGRYVKAHARWGDDLR